MNQSMKESSSLLSPPSSPRMSAYSINPTDSGWHDKNGSSAPHVDYRSLSTFPDSTIQSTVGDEHAPHLRSYRSYPYGLQSHFTRHQSPLGKLVISENDGVDQKPTESQSAPVSPNTQLTPKSAVVEPESLPREELEAVGDADADMINDELAEDDIPLDEESSGKTAAERRAEKRKMKRFRLTHSQTRFLMSEFTRQAHPDAAHRERLSREIPGLSPRQVQVWFQNRRAKLKRLTSDDRERMLKSRALPEDFDMSQALHAPYGGQPGLGTPLASPVTYFPPHYDVPMMRPLLGEGMRRPHDEEATTSPMTAPPAYTTFFTPPGSSTTSEAMSPISTTSDRPHHGGMQNASPRNANPFGRSSSFSTYHPGAQIPRLQIHDRSARSRAESLASPLRTSMSYTGGPMGYSATTMPPPYDPRRASDRSAMPAEQGSTAPFGMSSNYSSPSMHLRMDYRSPATTIGPYSTMHGAPVGTPSDFQYSQVSAPYPSAGYNLAYAPGSATSAGMHGQMSGYDQDRQAQSPTSSPNQSLHAAHDASRSRNYSAPYEFPGQMTSRP